MTHDGIESMDQLHAHLDRGWDLVQRGDFHGALRSAEEGLALDETSPEANNLMGYVQAATGSADEALQYYEQAIASDETFVEAMLNAAEVELRSLRNPEAALRHIDEALDYLEEPDEIADALLLRVDALLAKGDEAAARRTAARIPEGPFENPELPFLIGRARLDVGDLPGAAPLLEAAVRQDMTNPEVHYYLGLLLEAQGQEREATAAFLRTRELDLRRELPYWHVPTEVFERHVQAAMTNLPAHVRDRLEGALVVVSNVPGPEVVSDGVDPRIPVLITTLQEDMARVGQVFIYQLNVERAAATVEKMEAEILEAIVRELG
ncbi:MAG: tetratricopeptide repeat protein [Myxococcales bacterium]|nr:tetratricopeptide repeat protein [Myxococcales bacterium]